MIKIKMNKKANLSFEQILWIVSGLIILAIIISFNFNAILNALNGVIPGFESNKTQSSETPSTPVNVNVDDLCNNIKNEIKISDTLKQNLITAINHKYEVHVECGASNRAEPIIYLKSTLKVDYYMRWDYVKGEFVDLTAKPSITPEVILRTLADLEKILGVKA